LRLIREGYKKNICERCGLIQWMGNPIVLHLHHKNETHNDNRLDNLEILCPNCHSQSHTTRGMLV
jgi:5-methylcytosine-specific restriction endonuclease McrA